MGNVNKERIFNSVYPVESHLVFLNIYGCTAINPKISNELSNRIFEKFGVYTAFGTKAVYNGKEYQILIKL